VKKILQKILILYFLLLLFSKGEQLELVSTSFFLFFEAESYVIHWRYW